MPDSTPPSRSSAPDAPLAQLDDRELGAWLDSALKAAVQPGQTPGALNLPRPEASQGDAVWFVSIGEQQMGPLPLEQIREMWRKGDIGPATLCWRPGFAQWMSLGQVARLALPLTSPVELSAPAPATERPALPPSVANRLKEEIRALTGANDEPAPAPPERAPSSLLAEAAAEREPPPLPREAPPPLEPSWRERLEAEGWQRPTIPLPPEDERRARRLPVVLMVVVGCALVALLGLVSVLLLRLRAQTEALEQALSAALTAQKQPPPAVAPAPPPPDAQPPASAPVSAPARPPPPSADRSAAEARKVEAPREARVAEKASAVVKEEPEPPEPTGLDDEFSREFGSAESPEQPKPKRKTVYVPPEPASRPDEKDTLSESDVLEVVLAAKPALARCAEEQRRAQPGQSGTLLLRWKIQTDGRTSDVEVVSDELAGSPIASCISEAVQRWRFPPHRTVREPVTFPFKF